MIASCISHVKKPAKRVSFLREQNGKTARPQFELLSQACRQRGERVNYRVDDDDDDDVLSFNVHLKAGKMPA